MPYNKPFTNLASQSLLKKIRHLALRARSVQKDATPIILRKDLELFY